VEPDNRALIERNAREAERRSRGEPTLPSTIADERATNPFLRAALPNVKAAAEAHAGRSLEGPVSTFAEIRDWKNRFS